MFLFFQQKMEDKGDLYTYDGIKPSISDLDNLFDDDDDNDAVSDTITIQTCCTNIFSTLIYLFFRLHTPPPRPTRTSRPTATRTWRR